MRKPKILTTLKDYSGSAFMADLFAGFTVAMVAMPLSLAIAIASGAPPEKGLITAIIGGFLISLLGGSRVQVGGPTGAFIVVVFGVIAAHGYDGLVTATFMAGCMLVVAGFLRAGRLIALVPESVVNGFTIGIGIIIGTSQLADALGVTASGAGFVEKLDHLWAVRQAISPQAAGLTLATMVAIVALRRLFPRFPGLILAVGALSAAAYGFGLDVDTLGSRFGHLPAVLPSPSLPDLSLGKIIELLPSSLVIAFLAGVESLLSAMVADRMIAGHHRPNAELTAQGVANIGSALVGGLPATGAIARTATNIRAGGKTPVSGLVHAAVILLVMLLAAPLAEYLTLPCLAAVLLLTAWNMTEPHKWREYAKGRNADKFLLLVTLVLTVTVDLTVAIGVGVSLGALLRLSRRNRAESDWSPPER